MAKGSRRSSLRTRATVIAGITASILVAVALFGWLASWRTIDQYSLALQIAGAVAAGVGALSLLGNQTSGPDGQFGAASLEISHNQTRGQSDYYQDVRRSFAFFSIMASVGLLVAGSGFILQLLFG